MSFTLVISSLHNGRVIYALLCDADIEEIDCGQTHLTLHLSLSLSFALCFLLSLSLSPPLGPEESSPLNFHLKKKVLLSSSASSTSFASTFRVFSFYFLILWVPSFSILCARAETMLVSILLFAPSRFPFLLCREPFPPLPCFSSSPIRRPARFANRWQRADLA